MISEPFNELNETDKQRAIDCAVAVVILSTRIPTVGKSLHEWLIAEFANSYKLPAQVVRYALRHIGEALYDSDWAYSVTKQDQKLITVFEPAEEGPQGAISLN